MIFFYLLLEKAMKEAEDILIGMKAKNERQEKLLEKAIALNISVSMKEITNVIESGGQSFKHFK